MAEIVICTTGELILNGNLVGRVIFEMPYIEAEVSGVYDDTNEGQGCSCVCDECASPQVNVALRSNLQACLITFARRS